VSFNAFAFKDAIADGGVGIGRLDGVLPAAAFFAICQNVKINCQLSNTQLPF